MEHVVVQTGYHVAAARILKDALWMWKLAMIMILAHQITFAIPHFLARHARIGETLYVLILLFLHFRLSTRRQLAQKTWTFSNV
jgi:hypothetical protein